MSRAPKRQRYTLEEDIQAQTEARGLVGAQVPAAEEEEESSSSSSSFSLSFLSSLSSSSSSPSSSPFSSSLTVHLITSCFSSSSSSPPSSPRSSSPCSSSSSFRFSYPSTSSSSSPLNVGTQDEEEVPAAVTPTTHQSPQRSFSFSTSLSTSHEDSSSAEEEESPSTAQTSVGTESSPRDPLEEKVTDLVEFLLLKYQMRQPITKAEMLNTVIKRYKNQFTVIFERACKCMEVVFGVDVKEVDPTIHSYALVNSLDLTYGTMLIDEQSMPKNGLLIIILGMIFLEGNCSSEEEMWEFLNMMGVYAGREHFIYGEPRQLITRDWVQENYLEYRQVPNSDPARYEFLWGPRAHAETNKIKVLEFLAKINGTELSSFSPWYEEALKDEEERAQARIGPLDSTTAMCVAQHCPAASPAPNKD